jgi:hypothetical protein
VWSGAKKKEAFPYRIKLINHPDQLLAPFDAFNHPNKQTSQMSSSPAAPAANHGATPEQQQTRERHVFLARLSEQSERFDGTTP